MIYIVQATNESGWKEGETIKDGCVNIRVPESLAYALEVAEEVMGRPVADIVHLCEFADYLRDPSVHSRPRRLPTKEAIANG